MCLGLGKLYEKTQTKLEIMENDGRKAEKKIHSINLKVKAANGNFFLRSLQASAVFCWGSEELVYLGNVCNVVNHLKKTVEAIFGSKCWSYFTTVE